MVQMSIVQTRKENHRCGGLVVSQLLIPSPLTVILPLQLSQPPPSRFSPVLLSTNLPLPSLPHPHSPLLHLSLLVMGHMAIIEYLMASGANHLQADRDGNTPLHAACMKGNMPIIMYLVHRYNSVDHNTRNVAGQ